MCSLSDAARYNMWVFYMPFLPARMTCMHACVQVYSADEAFVTGTFAGVIPVVQVDGRVIGGGARGPVTQAIQDAYARFVGEYCAHGRQADADPAMLVADAGGALSLVVYR